jgi:hypothetical protein
LGSNLYIDNGKTAQGHGTSGDIPVPGDYLGDGIARQAVFRPSDGKFYIKRENNKSWHASKGNFVVYAGASGSVTPVPADYYGEGKLRIAIYRRSGKYGYWYIKGSGKGDKGMRDWGKGDGDIQLNHRQNSQNDIPVPADYFNEGFARIATFY